MIKYLNKARTWCIYIEKDKYLAFGVALGHGKYDGSLIFMFCYWTLGIGVYKNV